MSKTVLLWDLKKEYNSSFISNVEKRVQQKQKYLQTHNTSELNRKVIDSNQC